MPRCSFCCGERNVVAGVHVAGVAIAAAVAHSPTGF